MSSANLSLTPEQQFVLQAIYDQFRKRGAWPTFISIDRPLRRTHNLDTQAILQGLPDSLIVKTRPGIWFRADDELKLRLPGIDVCQGGAEDIERFVRLLHWLAQKEIEFEPEQGSAETMPRATAFEVMQYLGLRDDLVALERLYTMLHLDHWGLGGGGSDPDGWWFVTVTPDIWRFRDVQTAEDCVRAREQWQTEAEAANPRMHSVIPPDGAQTPEERSSAADIIDLVLGNPDNFRPAGALPRPGDPPLDTSTGPTSVYRSNIQNQIDGDIQGQAAQAGVIHGGVQFNNYYPASPSDQSARPSAPSSADPALAQARLVLIDHFPYTYGEGVELGGTFSVHVELICTNHGERPVLDARFEVWMGSASLQESPSAFDHKKIVVSRQKVQFDAKPYVVRGEDRITAWRLRWRDIDGHSWYLDPATEADPLPFTGQPPAKRA